MRVKNLLGRFTSQKSNPLMYQPDQREPCLETLPDFVVTLVGWRVWKVWTPLSGSDSFSALSSVMLDVPWAPRRKVTAEHSFDLGQRCRGIVEFDCSCGVYAFKNPADAFKYSIRVRDRLLGMSVEVALGTVSLWGRVVECERGYKAQFAYPRHICLPASVSRFAPKVSSAFGVAVGVYASTRKDQITIPNSLGAQILHLKNSDCPWCREISFEVGLYDVIASLPRLLNSPSILQGFVA